MWDRCRSAIVLGRAVKTLKGLSVAIVSMRRLILVSAVLASSWACIPYHGTSQIPVPQTPVSFVHSENGDPVGTVLMVPTYSTFKGASTLGGEGPGKGTHTRFVASPFIYSSGQDFTVPLYKSTGVAWGITLAATGKGVSLGAVLVLAPGYEPFWYWDLWNGDRCRPIPLDPAQPHRALELLHQWSQMFDTDVISDNHLFCLENRPCEVHNRFTDEEKAEVQRFLGDAIRRLESEPGIP
jgi:hypothetical protein